MNNQVVLLKAWMFNLFQHSPMALVNLNDERMGKKGFENSSQVYWHSKLNRTQNFPTICKGNLLFIYYVAMAHLSLNFMF